mgnify:CR=1 FL=1
MSGEITIIAIGGNATHPEETDGTADEQKRISYNIARKLVPLIKKEKRLIITYGNGPVVGKILLRQVLSKEHVEPMPLDICVAHSQGGIAFLLIQAIENALRELELERNIATLMTRVLVSKTDPSFSNPTKPIGVFYTEKQAKVLSDEHNWCMKEDAGRGWLLLHRFREDSGKPGSQGELVAFNPHNRHRGGGRLRWAGARSPRYAWNNTRVQPEVPEEVRGS